MTERNPKSGPGARAMRRNSLGWMIQRLSGRVADDMGRAVAPLGLSLPQFAVMMTVLEEDGLSQSQIGRKFRMPAYAISRALDGLAAQGYVERRANPASRRAHGIHATAKGLGIAPRLFAIVDERNAAIAAPLSPEELAVFTGLLRRLLDRPEAG